MKALDRVIDAAERHALQVRRRGSAYWITCPSPEHDDRHPSCQVNEHGDRVYLRCWSRACAFETMLGGLGLAPGDLRDGDRRPRLPSVPRLKPTAPRPSLPREVLDEYRQAAHEALLSSPAARRARSYLRGRGVDGDMVRHFELGFGVRIGHEQLDRLAGRVVVVTHVGAKGRTVDGRRPPYLTLAHDEGAWLADSVDPARPVVLVEGSFDVLALHRIGAQAVALGGKHLDTADARLLSQRGFRRAYLSLDGDAPLEAWRKLAEVCHRFGIEPVPLLGPAIATGREDVDWGDLLLLPDDDYFRVAAAALCNPKATP